VAVHREVEGDLCALAPAGSRSRGGRREARAAPLDDRQARRPVPGRGDDRRLDRRPGRNGIAELCGKSLLRIKCRPRLSLDRDHDRLILRLRPHSDASPPGLLNLIALADEVEHDLTQRTPCRRQFRGRLFPAAAKTSSISAYRAMSGEQCRNQSAGMERAPGANSSGRDLEIAGPRSSTCRECCSRPRGDDGRNSLIRWAIFLPSLGPEASVGLPWSSISGESR